LLDQIKRTLKGPAVFLSLMSTSVVRRYRSRNNLQNVSGGLPLTPENTIGMVPLTGPYDYMMRALWPTRQLHSSAIRCTVLRLDKIVMRLSTLLFAMIVVAFCDRASCTVSEDSVPAFARALSELPPGSSVLELPEGTYTIGSTWTIRRTGITIRGAGIGKTVLTRDPTFTGPLVIIGAENSSITNLTIDGKRTVNMVFLARTGDVADTIEVKGFTHIGIAVPPSGSGCRISNCLITGPTTQTTMAIWHDAGRTSTDSTIMIDHNVIKNTGLYGTGGQITIADNQISGEPNPGGGQIDIGNAFTTNTVAFITGNSILNGGTVRTGGIEMGGGSFTVTNNIVRNHGLAGMGVGHNVIRATITGNTVSNSGHDIADKNRPQCRSGIYVLYGAANVEISGNRCFDDQPNKTQTWGIILCGPPMRPDPRFSPKAIEHLVMKGNDLRGNIHSEGLLDEGRVRDKLVSGNLPSQANH